MTADKIIAMTKVREVVVDTHAGRLAGQAVDDGFVFKGIPYGEAPEGELRFRPPVMKSPWSGLRKATAFGPICVQTNEDYPAWCDETPVSEDCLVANVWTPTLEGGAKLPVMVWIHGGAFANGSAGLAIYDGAQLSQSQRVVVVSINHRLNIFGFLFLGGIAPTYADSANLGLQDIELALLWTRGNVAHFGGDPENVTLFGESGGGAKIAALMGMPRARGLFSRVIIQSGWLLNTLTQEEAAQRADLVCRTLDVRGKHIDRLRFLPAAMLNEAGAQLLAESGSGMFFPVADGSIIPANPWASKVGYPGATIPMLIGTTADEGAYFVPEAMHKSPLASDHELCQAIAQLADPLHLDPAESRMLLEMYRKAQSRWVTRNRCLMDLLTSILFLGSAVHQAERHSARANVFMYRFDWTYPCWGRRYSPHAAEIPFVFGTLNYAKAAFGVDDSLRKRASADPGGDRFTLARQIQRSWAAFARCGDPSHSDIPLWKGYSSESRATMILDRQCRVEIGAHEAARKLAKKLNLTRRSVRPLSPSRATRARAKR
jgi:para-nitrobenzyl esterase